MKLETRADYEAALVKFAAQVADPRQKEQALQTLAVIGGDLLYNLKRIADALQPQNSTIDVGRTRFGK